MQLHNKTIPLTLRGSLSNNNGYLNSQSISKDNKVSATKRAVKSIQIGISCAK